MAPAGCRDQRHAAYDPAPERHGTAEDHGRHAGDHLPAPTLGGSQDLVATTLVAVHGGEIARDLVYSPPLKATPPWLFASRANGPFVIWHLAAAAALLAAAVALRDRESKSRLRPEKRRRALACAVSNVAADNLLEALLRLNVSAVRVGHPAATREELRKRKLATSGSGLRAAVHRRACIRRTTEVPQRLRTHTETSQSTPRFQTRGPRRCRRII